MNGTSEIKGRTHSLWARVIRGGEGGRVSQVGEWQEGAGAGPRKERVEED